MTVQEMVENCLRKLTGVKTTLYFVARTDAGVHAYGQECTFYTESTIPGDRFLYAMNACLPYDIRVTASREVDMDFSVRRRNYGKTYGYLLTEERKRPPSSNDTSGAPERSWTWLSWKRRPAHWRGAMTLPPSAEIIPSPLTR